MPLLVEKEATVTDKGQITVPKAVREALGVGYGGRIKFRVDENGVSLHRAEDVDDPVLASFLAFLAKDMERRPEALAALTPEFRERVEKLVQGVRADPDEEIEGETAL